MWRVAYADPMRSTGRVIRNWARNEACIPVAVHRPSSTAAVAGIVRSAHRDGRRVRVIGGGHSFTPAAMTSGDLISLDAMTEILAVDRDAATVTVQAGIRLHDLNERLAELGLAMPNLGDIDVQSLAGAISTATHGTGLAFGNLATTVIGLELVTGTGEIVRVDADHEPDLLRHARVSLGAFGVITEATLQLVPAFRLHAVETVELLDDVLADVDAFARSADHAELFWMPGARRCQVKRNRRTDEPAQPQPTLAYVRDKWIGENLGFGLVCRAGRRFPALAPRVAKLVAGSATERELIDRSDKVFASPRHVKFLEMEYGIPLEHLPEAVARIRGLTGELSFPPLFPIEVRVSAADDIPLSTGYGRTNGWVAVHQYRGAPYEAYFQGVEAIMRSLSGRPHWGKMHYRTAADLRPEYPEWDTFAKWRTELDPDGTFRNPYVDRVLG